MSVCMCACGCVVGGEMVYGCVGGSEMVYGCGGCEGR